MSLFRVFVSDASGRRSRTCANGQDAVQTDSWPTHMSKIMFPYHALALPGACMPRASVNDLGMKATD